MKFLFIIVAILLLGANAKWDPVYDECVPRNSFMNCGEGDKQVEDFVCDDCTDEKPEITGAQSCEVECPDSEWIRYSSHCQYIDENNKCGKGHETIIFQCINDSCVTSQPESYVIECEMYCEEESEWKEHHTECIPSEGQCGSGTRIYTYKCENENGCSTEKPEDKEEECEEDCNSDIQNGWIKTRTNCIVADTTKSCGNGSRFVDYYCIEENGCTVSKPTGFEAEESCSVDCMLGEYEIAETCIADNLTTNCGKGVKHVTYSCPEGHTCSTPVPESKNDEICHISCSTHPEWVPTYIDCSAKFSESSCGGGQYTIPYICPSGECSTQQPVVENIDCNIPCDEETQWTRTYSYCNCETGYHDISWICLIDGGCSTEKPADETDQCICDNNSDNDEWIMYNSQCISHEKNDDGNDMLCGDGNGYSILKYKCANGDGCTSDIPDDNGNIQNGCELPKCIEIQWKKIETECIINDFYATCGMGTKLIDYEEINSGSESKPDDAGSVIECNIPCGWVPVDETCILFDPTKSCGKGAITLSYECPSENDCFDEDLPSDDGSLRACDIPCESEWIQLWTQCTIAADDTVEEDGIGIQQLVAYEYIGAEEGDNIPNNTRPHDIGKTRSCKMVLDNDNDNSWLTTWSTCELAKGAFGFGRQEVTSIDCQIDNDEVCQETKPENLKVGDVKACYPNVGEEWLAEYGQCISRDDGSSKGDQSITDFSCMMPNNACTTSKPEVSIDVTIECQTSYFGGWIFYQMNSCMLLDQEATCGVGVKKEAIGFECTGDDCSDFPNSQPPFIKCEVECPVIEKSEWEPIFGSCNAVSSADLCGNVGQRYLEDYMCTNSSGVCTETKPTVIQSAIHEDCEVPCEWSPIFSECRASNWKACGAGRRTLLDYSCIHGDNQCITRKPDYQRGDKFECNVECTTETEWEPYESCSNMDNGLCGIGSRNVSGYSCINPDGCKSDEPVETGTMSCTRPCLDDYNFGYRGCGFDNGGQTCGVGTMTKNWYCVSAFNCYSSKPTDQDSIACEIPCINEWEMTISECVPTDSDKQCGKGTQIIDFVCPYDDSSLCTSNKPESAGGSIPCEIECPPQWEAIYGTCEFDTPLATCGKGTQNVMDYKCIAGEGKCTDANPNTIIGSHDHFSSLSKECNIPCDYEAIYSSCEIPSGKRCGLGERTLQNFICNNENGCFEEEPIDLIGSMEICFVSCDWIPEIECELDSQEVDCGIDAGIERFNGFKCALGDGNCDENTKPNFPISEAGQPGRRCNIPCNTHWSSVYSTCQLPEKEACGLGQKAVLFQLCSVYGVNVCKDEPPTNFGDIETCEVDCKYEPVTTECILPNDKTCGKGIQTITDWNLIDNNFSSYPKPEVNISKECFVECNFDEDEWEPVFSQCSLALENKDSTCGQGTHQIADLVCMKDTCESPKPIEQLGTVMKCDIPCESELKNWMVEHGECLTEDSLDIIGKRYITIVCPEGLDCLDEDKPKLDEINYEICYSEVKWKKTVTNCILNDTDNFTCGFGKQNIIYECLNDLDDSCVAPPSQIDEPCYVPCVEDQFESIYGECVIQDSECGNGLSYPLATICNLEDDDCDFAYAPTFEPKECEISCDWEMKWSKCVVEDKINHCGFGEEVLEDYLCLRDDNCSGIEKPSEGVNELARSCAIECEYDEVWGKCSYSPSDDFTLPIATCGSDGKETLSYECNKINSGEDECTLPKPTNDGEQRDCSTVCPEWLPTWGSCNLDDENAICGEIGTLSSIDYNCPTGFCLSEKPTEVLFQPCRIPCDQWEESWSECKLNDSADFCGNGSHTSSYKCNFPTCTASRPSSETEDCEVPCEWEEFYSPCWVDGECGSGKQYMDYKCTAPFGNCSSSKPNVDYSQNERECEVPCSDEWERDFSDCKVIDKSMPCGVGIQDITWRCKNEDWGEECTSEKPEANIGMQCHVNCWQPVVETCKLWESNKSCGRGNGKVTDYKCVFEDESKCDSNERPQINDDNESECEIECPDPEWIKYYNTCIADDQSSSDYCISGTQDVFYVCRDEHCETEKPQDGTSQCQANCGDGYGDWGSTRTECIPNDSDNQCGEGKLYEVFYCRNDENGCNDDEKPPTTEHSCMKSCDDIEEPIEYVPMDLTCRFEDKTQFCGTGGKTVTEAYFCIMTGGCESEQPETGTIVDCDDECSKNGYDIEYSSCETFDGSDCGAGVQTRSYKCPIGEICDEIPKSSQEICHISCAADGSNWFPGFVDCSANFNENKCGKGHYTVNYVCPKGETCVGGQPIDEYLECNIECASEQYIPTFGDCRAQNGDVCGKGYRQRSFYCNVPEGCTDEAPDSDWVQCDIPCDVSYDTFTSSCITNDDISMCGDGIFEITYVCAGDTDNCILPNTEERYCSIECEPEWKPVYSLCLLDDEYTQAGCGTGSKKILDYECSVDDGCVISEKPSDYIGSIEDCKIPCQADEWKAKFDISECILDDDTAFCGNGGFLFDGYECVVEDGNCLTDKPTDIPVQMCKEECGEWIKTTSQCDAYCGEGKQEVTYTCPKDKYCGFEVPHEILDCTHLKYPVCGEWFTSRSQCSEKCGLGSLDVTYSCSRERCLGDKPDSFVEECKVMNCPTYELIGWTECPTCKLPSTSPETHTYYKCVLDGENSNFCGAMNVEYPKEETKECDIETCETFFEVGEFGECSKKCGTGNRTRDIQCKSHTPYSTPDQPSYKSLDDIYCIEEGHDKPYDEEECNTEPCDYRWSTTNYSSCSTDCGVGEMTWDVICRWFIDGSYETVSDDFCGDKPETSRKCERYYKGESCLEFELSPIGDCSVECGGGIRNNELKCMIAGVEMTEKNDPDGVCIEKFKSFGGSYTSYCNTQACPTMSTKYEWQMELDDTCRSVDTDFPDLECGFGQKTKSPICMKVLYEDDKEIFRSESDNESDCSPHTKPEDEFIGCKFDEECYIYAYKGGDWGDCSATCNGGTMKRAISCIGTHIGDDSRTITALMGKCVGTVMPESSTTCNEELCTVGYEWIIGEWQECPAKCSTSYQQRKVTCEFFELDSNGDEVRRGTAGNNSGCLTLGDKPATMKSCIDECIDYRWHIGAYSDCIATEGTCGYGTRTTPLSCRKYVNAKDSGVIVEEEECQDAYKPRDTYSCEVPCEVSREYKWVTGEFGKCTQPCFEPEYEIKYGYSYREVSCVSTDLDGNDERTEERSKCIGILLEREPIDRYTCGQERCPSYSWHWSQKSGSCARCGTDYERITYKCIDDVALTYANIPGACDIEERPPTEIDCGDNDCYIPVEWKSNIDEVTCPTRQIGENLCGTEELDVNVWCIESDSKETVGTSRCIESYLPSPDSSKFCPKYCPGDYKLIYSDWSDCSIDCGIGIQTRSIEKCVVTVENNNRALRMLQTEEVEMTTQDCLDHDVLPEDLVKECKYVDCSAYYWDVSDFGNCNVYCNGGLKYRTVVCRDSNGEEADETFCEKNESKPTTNEICNNHACPSVGWKLIKDWECSFNCGDTVYATRTVSCMDTTGRQVSSKKCAEIEPMWETRRSYCIENDDVDIWGRTYTKTCPGASYIWEPELWDSCSKPCVQDGIIGEQTRAVPCIMTKANGLKSIVSDSFCEANPKPSESRDCNEFECFNWAVKGYSQCNKECGSGTRTVDVQCFDYFNRRTDDTNCESVPNKPAYIESCNTDPCQNFCDTTTCNGNTCNRETEECECSEFTDGLYCQDSVFCSGTMMSNGDCCTNAVSYDEKCCVEEGAVLDIDGNCCESGLLDACGKCDGVGILDGSGECCLGSLDAAERCCPSPNEVDQCGKCSGDNICPVNIDISDGRSIQMSCAEYLSAVTDPNSIDNLAERDNLALLMGIDNPEDLTITSVSCEAAIVSASLSGISSSAPYEYVRLLAETQADVQMGVAVKTDEENPLPISELTTQISDNLATNAPNMDTDIGIGLCGDGECSLDEQCTNPDDPKCCSQDCPIPDICPTPIFSDQQCGGSSRGFCKFGICECHNGYASDSDACDKCATGFVMDDTNHCTKVFIGLKVIDDSSGSSGSSDSNANGSSDSDSDFPFVLIVAVVGLSGVVLVGLIVLKSKCGSRNDDDGIPRPVSPDMYTLEASPTPKDVSIAAPVAIITTPEQPAASNDEKMATGEQELMISSDNDDDNESNSGHDDNDDEDGSDESSGIEEPTEDNDNDDLSQIITTEAVVQNDSPAAIETSKSVVQMNHTADMI
eukprot:TRINITY_DN4657_c0_g2_i1.p1 TRINITY_DN4657_c0_g2~~TRINITY_DN4657_c0_g2_i1.p1  ORF type:complete len:4200 (-),score=1219.65 TRINITY_DN4657_c0_g2_i1:243-12842(-)